jgi:hypothetical protein
VSIALVRVQVPPTALGLSCCFMSNHGVTAFLSFVF